jgi:hypothetical protein
MERPQVKESRFELRVAYSISLLRLLPVLPFMIYLFRDNFLGVVNMVNEIMMIAAPMLVLVFQEPSCWKFICADGRVSLKEWGLRKSLECSRLEAIADFQNSSLKLVTDDGKVYRLRKVLDGNRALLDFANFCRENNYSFKMSGEEPGHNGWRITTYLTRAINWNWKEASGYQSKGSLDLDESPQEISIKDDILILEREGREVVSAHLSECELIVTTSRAVKEGESRLMVEMKGQGRWPLVDWDSVDYAEVVYVLIDKGVRNKNDSASLVESRDMENRGLSAEL